MDNTTVYGIRTASGRAIAFYSPDNKDSALGHASLGEYDAFVRDYVRGSVARYEKVGPGHYRLIQETTHG